MVKNDDVIGVEFSAVMDDRTTQICASKHGLVMRLNDPRLPEFIPPQHVHCRSMILPVTTYDYPDGLFSSHEFDEILPVEQREIDVEFVQAIFKAKKSAYNQKEKEETKYNETEFSFTPAKTIKEANQIAIQLGIAYNADFKGLDVRVANEMIESILQNKKLFPELRTFDFVGSTQEYSHFYVKVQQEKAWNKVKDNLIKKLPKVSEENIKDMFLKRLEEKGIIKKIRASSRDYAASYENADAFGIVINNRRFSTSHLVENLESLQNDVNTKYSPVHCEKLKALMDHEVAHQVDVLLKSYEDVKILEIFNKYHNNGMSDVLSEYADTDIYEFIAEAWSEYMNNPNPRPVAKAVGERMFEIHRGKFSN